MDINITQEEIDQYILLKEKISKFEQSMIEKENAVNAALLQKPEYSGVIPHQLNITVMVDVYQIQSDIHMAPIIIEKLSQSYIVDFLDKSYKPLVDSVYNNMTKVLENSCKDLVKNGSSDNEVSV
jgi:hypothetical protein